jgi:hypothetical protein
VNLEGENWTVLAFDSPQGCCYNGAEESGIYGVAWGQCTFRRSSCPQRMCEGGIGVGQKKKAPKAAPKKPQAPAKSGKK